MKDLNRVARFLWGAALLALPVTSFRYYPFWGEGTYVRPLSLYPLALLVPLLFVQIVRGKRIVSWSGSMILLGVFAFAVLLATGFGALHDPIPLRGQNYLGRAVRALVTLVVGLIFFISAVWMNRGEDDLRFTIKWMTAGLGLDLAWSGLQAVTFYTGVLEREMVTHWQLAFSMRELVRTNRVSGLAYEPAWLAGQITTMYLPVLFASLLTGIRITRAKWLEPVLFALSLLLLLATYSRGGILIAFGAGGLTLLLVGRGAIRGSLDWFISSTRGRTFEWVLRLGMITIVVGIFAGAIVFLSQKGFFRRMWESNATSLNEYLVDINAGARGAYVIGALSAFEKYPRTGAGLGASGFYVYQNLPDWAQTTVPEIARQLAPANRLYPNPKNLYVRLLAETGLIGFVLFTAFMFSLLGDALAALRGGGLTLHLGIAGLFAWLAIALYNLTQDSLAIPNIWLVPGILTSFVGGDAVSTYSEENK